MSIYGHKSVNLAQLKEWAKKLDVEQVLEKSKNGLYGQYASDDICRDLLGGFLRSIEDLVEGDEWYDKTIPILNHALIPAVFMVADNAIRVANYYEIIILASDIETKKKMIKGFSYLDVGYLHVIQDGKAIATIGQKSDLIWLCLYELFIKHDQFSIEHTLPNHEEIMSLQLADTWGLSEYEIRDLVNEILFRCSTELNLNFKIYHIDPLITKEGVSGYYELKSNMEHYESIPIMYFNCAFAIEDVRMQYLSYYHVIEYFFIRAQNHKFIDTIQVGGYLTTPLKHNELHKVLKKYAYSMKELDSLKLVINKAIDAQTLINWIDQVPERATHLANNTNQSIILNVAMNSNELLSKLTNRIYYFRCSIAHAKGDTDEYMAMPEIGNSEISKEISLIRWVAENVIKQCSNW